jgi:uncharacterized protein YceK
LDYKGDIMKIKTYKAFLYLAIFIVLSGCATIMSGANQEITIRTTPDNATVRIYQTANRGNFYIGSSTTPTVVTLKRLQNFGESYRIEIIKEGFQSQIITIRSGIDGWYWGNVPLALLLGAGLVGAVIDVLTGSAYALRPSEINVNLLPALNIGMINDDELIIMLKEEIPEDIFSKLDLILISE